MESKTQRILFICERLFIERKGISTDEIMNKFGVHRVSVINYMNEIRSYLVNTYHFDVDLLYDHYQDEYVIKHF